MYCEVRVTMIIIPFCCLCSIFTWLECVLRQGRPDLPPLQGYWGQSGKVPCLRSHVCLFPAVWADVVPCLAQGLSGRAPGSLLTIHVLESSQAWEPEFSLARASVSPPGSGCPSNPCMFTGVSDSDCAQGGGWCDCLLILLLVVLKSRLYPTNIFTAAWDSAAVLAREDLREGLVRWG